MRICLARCCRFHIALLRALLCLGGSLLAGLAVADSALQFDLPALPMPEALRMFATQTDTQLLYQYDAVKDARANRLVGRFERAEALRQLLHGTGLEAVFTAANAATIRRLPRDGPAPPNDRAGRFKTVFDGPQSAQGDSDALHRRRLAKSTEEESPEEVTVTGSRIRRIAIDTLQPTQTFDRRAIEERGYASTAELFAELPSFGPPGNSPVGGQSSVGVGQSFLNFLGLGSQRTLTLIDGRRFVAANTPSINGATAPGLQVDLNTIPLALIERVEVVAVGGAPVYGADAVAGTVNIIRRKDFRGFSGAAQVGTTQRDDGGRRRVQAAYGRGFAGERGNVAVTFEYGEQDGMRAIDRDVIARALTFQAPADRASPYRQTLVPNSRVVLVNFNGLPLTAPVANRTDNFRYAVSDAQGRPLQFASDGSLIPFDAGALTGSTVFASGGDGLNLAETTSLLTDSRRKLANVFVDYDVSDSLSLGVEGWFARTRSRELVNQPAFNESSFRSSDETEADVREGPLALRLDNPFLSDASRATIARNIDINGDGTPDPILDFDGDGVAETPGFWLAKGHEDLFAANPSTSTQDLHRAVVGLRGMSALAGRPLEWDVSYNVGRTRSTSLNLALLHREFNRAIDAVRDPVSGAIRCRDDAAGCAPLNVFGSGAPSAQAIDYVTTLARTRSEIEQRVWSANVSGSPFAWRAGPLQLAGGVEYRRESSAFRPDEILSSGAVRGAMLTPISGSFHTKEVYAEAVMPLIGAHQAVRYAHSLHFESAFRHVDHSTAGADVTWTSGLRFAPHEDVKLRGNYTQSIRAPAITELFLPTTTVYAFAADPCDQRLLHQGPNARHRAANCAAAGITQPFNARILNATQQMTIEGNRALESEQADAWTLGVVLQPHRVPGLTLALDWMEIDLTNAIERFDGSTVLRACYDSADFPNAEVCGRFRRDSDGQVRDLRTGFLNAGTVDFAGMTAELIYEADLGRAGALTLGLRYFHLDRLDVSVTGSDLNPGAGEISNSRHRASAQLSYRRGPLRSSLHAQYIGPAVFDLTDGPADREVRGVDAFWVINTGVGYTLPGAVTLQLNVDNVFDEAPPYPGMANTLGLNGGTATGTYFAGVLGRSYVLRAYMGF